MEFLAWFFVAWFGFSAWVGLRASQINRSGGAFFVLSMVFSPVLGGVLLGILGRGRPNEREVEQAREAERIRVQSQTMRKCPMCAEMVQREAVKCRFCAADLGPTAGAR